MIYQKIAILTFDNNLVKVVKVGINHGWLHLPLLHKSSAPSFFANSEQELLFQNI